MNHMIVIFSLVNKHKGFFFLFVLAVVKSTTMSIGMKISQRHTEFIFSEYTPSSGTAALYVLFQFFKEVS